MRTEGLVRIPVPRVPKVNPAPSDRGGLAYLPPVLPER